jgi:hypothetical protein
MNRTRSLVAQWRAIWLTAAMVAGSALAQPVAQDGAPVGVSPGTHAIAKIRVSAPPGELLADGHTVLQFTVAVLDAQGAPIKEGLLSVTTDGGMLIDGDGHPAAQGLTALPFRDGAAGFDLLVPARPGEVHIRVAAGRVTALGTLRFLPELRDMIAVGVIEGVISKHSLSADSIAPARFSDGFEREIESWSRQLGGNLDGAGRVAFFLKGKISGDALLTAAYDSDKETRAKLATTIDPNAVYPVYGDNSIVGFEAQSASRLFVRIDKDRSYLLYGDFSTGGTSAAGTAASGTPPGASLRASSAVSIQSTKLPDEVLLGRYDRTATGLRGHYEDAANKADAFVIDDTLSRVIEEDPANGTSGPFAIRNNNAIQNSELVEVIVRDKNQRGVIKSITPLVRYVDYSFEPFSGQILLQQPLPSLSPSGDPVSLRITYEVDLGGARFLTYGASVSRQLNAAARIGASDVEDRNPLAPYRLSSVNADVALSSSLRLVAEAARTSSTLFSANGQVYALPSGQPGEVGAQLQGDAERVELLYKGAAAEGRLWWLRAGTGFNNQSAGVAPGREDVGARGSVPIADGVKLYAESMRSTDALTQTGRQANQIGILDKLSKVLTLDFSLRHLEDNSAFPPEATIAPNAAGPGAGYTVAGGFFGTGTGSTVVDPLTGAAINTLAPVGSTATAAPGRSLNATTARLASSWQATPQLRVDGALERSIDGEDHSSTELGAVYALTEREKAYVRAETQTGLASANSLLPADRSNSFIVGLTHGVSDETSVFSEYRLVDAAYNASPSTFDQLVANGLRNVHPLAAGLSATSTAELLRVFDGTQRQALALGSRLDYTAHPDWKASGTIEFRRLGDDPSLPGDQSQRQWLSTLTVARKLDASWTLLLKNYLLLHFNHDDVAGNPIGDTREERFLIGAAWRPLDNNRINGLARYEYKSVSDQSQPLGEHYDAHIASATMDYHPDRYWWMTGRVAVKRETDFNLPVGSQAFDAWLVGGRLTRDLTDKIDIGVMFSTLHQQAGIARQSAYGFETGYLVATNMWVSLGYNLAGFTDRDLAASDYTQRNIYVRLRAKFDETLFGR